MRRILLLANPLLAKQDGRALLSILRVFKEAGADVDVLETGANRAAGAKAKRAVEQGVDAVIVCGGDGTVFDALQGVAGTEVPLGIVPFGTGNILAQNLEHRKAANTGLASQKSLHQFRADVGFSRSARRKECRGRPGRQGGLCRHPAGGGLSHLPHPRHSAN